MYLAAQEIAENQGGLVAARDGQILGVLPLPIGGLMSPLSAEEVMQELIVLNKVAVDLGCDLPALRRSWQDRP